MDKLEKEILGRCQTQRAYDFMLYVLQNKSGYSTTKYFELTGVTPRQQGGLRYSFGYTYGAEFKKLKNGMYKLVKLTGQKSDKYYKRYDIKPPKGRDLKTDQTIFEKYSELLCEVFA